MTTIQLIIVGGGGFIAVLLIVALLVIRRRRRKLPAEPGPIEPMDAAVAERLGIEVEAPLVQPDAQHPIVSSRSVVPHSKILAMVGARQLLEDVNTHVLKGEGGITFRPGSAQLIWSQVEDPSVRRSIMISVQDHDTVRVNGLAFPATPEGVKEGLVEYLKRLREV